MKILSSLLVIIAILTLSAPVQAGSFWWGGTSDGPFYPDGSDKGYMDITLWWSSSKAEKFDKYKFCWRKKSNTSKGKDPCLYNEIFTEDVSVEISASDKQILASTTYKIRIRARKEKNDKWKTLTSWINNPCIWASGTGFKMSCKSNPSD